MKRNMILYLANLCMFSSQILCMERAAQNAGASEAAQPQRTREQEIEYVREKAKQLAIQELTRRHQELIERLDAEYRLRDMERTQQFYAELAAHGKKWEQILRDELAKIAKRSASSASEQNSEQLSPATVQNIQPPVQPGYMAMLWQLFVRLMGVRR